MTHGKEEGSDLQRLKQRDRNEKNEEKNPKLNTQENRSNRF